MYKNKALDIYFVRHGETEWNKLEKIQGEMDSELTLKGINDSNKLKQNLSHIKFNAIYSSELGRAYKTAQLLNTNSLKIKKLKEFNEKNFGLWQGMTKKEIFKMYPEEANAYYYNIKEYNSLKIKAESIENALMRFKKGVKIIIDSNKSGNILVVSHGTILKLFFNDIDNKNIEELNENDLMNNNTYRVIRYNMKNLTKKVK